MNHRTALSALALGLLLNAAAEAPIWLRDVKISPDGSRIAFTYKGDVFTVGSNGGRATRLTSSTSGAINTDPIWSPDGQSIAFASTRHGSADIFVMNADGSSPRRLTSYSGNETPEAFSADGKQIYFSAAIQDPASSISFPSGRLTELYAVGISGSAPTQIIATPAQQLSVSPDGSFMLYQDVKGMENNWRKHHTSSVTRGLWRYDFATGRHTSLVDHAGEDLNPVISSDGQSMLFLSERNGGSMNVYSVPLASPGVTPTALTSFTEHPVRFLSQASNGMITLTFDGEIYTMASPSATPRKLDIEIVDNDYSPITIESFSSGAEQAVPSPDGKLVAFIRRGDLFVTSVEYNTTRQITSTAQAESSPSWSKDSRSLYYVSDRSGTPNIYVATMDRADDSDMANATLIKEEILIDDATARTSAKVSPDGKKIAYFENGSDLVMMDLKSKKVTRLTDDSINPAHDDLEYEWNPDATWIALSCVGNRHDPYSDIAIVNADGTTPQVTFVTQTGYFDTTPHWSADGRAIIFESDRYGMRAHASWGSQSDVMVAFVNQESLDRFRLNKEDYARLKDSEKKAKADDSKAKDEKKSKKSKKSSDADDDKGSESTSAKVEREGIADRVVRLTPNSASIGDAAMSADGEKLYYMSKGQSGYDLWSIDLREGDVSVANKLGAGGSPSLTVVGDDLFILSGRTMKKMAFAGEKMTNISYSARQKIDTEAERAYMLDYVRRMEQERFYRVDMHGVDWPNLVEHYKRFLPHINNNHDFSEMLSELLGELNVSHTGSGYRAGGAEESTADLGLIYDLTFAGPGLKVAEVVKNGPFDKASIAIAPGDILTAINGTKIDTESADITSRLNGLSGTKTLVTYTHGGKEQQEVVRPISSGAMSQLLYDRWVRRNAAMVDSLSGGRLGYVHIQSMNDDSFRPVYADLLGKYYQREGVVIDTRWNGGGRMHEDIEVLLSGEKYLTQVVRGRETCDMPSRRWNKPSIMLQCEANYSNAHGTPWVYSHRGLGKLVGMPVPGTMTSVNWVTLQDPTMYFGIPVIGYRLPDGSYLENKQLEPDVRVANSPEHVAAGIDDQLRAAVTTLLHDIDSQK